MKLYNIDLSPNALRVRAVAKELGVDLEIVDLDMRKGENRSDAYLAINPNGKVPVFVDSDETSTWQAAREIRPVPRELLQTVESIRLCAAQQQARAGLPLEFPQR